MENIAPEVRLLAVRTLHISAYCGTDFKYDRQCHPKLVDSMKIYMPCDFYDDIKSAIRLMPKFRNDP